MSTWICNLAKTAAAALSLAALLTGCMEAGSSSGEFVYSRRAPQSVTVADAVVVAGPGGYCVDMRATHGTFVLLASCTSVMRKPNAPQPFAPALLTATVTPQRDGEPPIAQQIASLKLFFNSRAGRAALSRDGQPESVELVEIAARNGVFIIHLRDHSEETAPGLGGDQWRAIFDVNGQIVSASVTELAERPITSDGGMATVIDFAAHITSESQKLVTNSAT